MCFPWFLLKKKQIVRRFDQIFACSCNICGKNFSTMDELITHMGCHDTGDMNRKLLNGYGTVRCNRCWKAFDTVADMHDHPCSTTIRGLSPIQSYDSLDSVVIHS
jgi:predicted nucleic acid-binding Zn ribbon protein